MMNHLTSNLASVDWLNSHLNDANLIVLDATMKKKPNGDEIPSALIRIPGAKPFNFDTEICDKKSSLPHMLPPAVEFESAVKQLGINQDSIVVVYDMMGIFSSPRAWWMFKVMGHQQVYVLNGGLPKWLEANLPTEPNQLTEANDEADQLGNFQANFDATQVSSVTQVLTQIDDPDYQLIDARSKARFMATEPEPRSELKGGHIPNSSCLPFNELIHKGLFKSREELRLIFDSVIEKRSKQLVFSCGSGVTACILALAAAELGYTNTHVYDGSWSEWGSRNDLPIAK